MKRSVLSFLLALCMFLFACSSAPTLDATSAPVYKQTLQKILDAQKDDATRLEVANAILYIVSDGKERPVKDIAKVYSLYEAMSFFGGAGKLMAMNGKNAEEILTLGREARKQWVQANVPAAIAELEKEISAMEEEQALVGKMTEAEKAFTLENVTLEPREALAAGSNKPLGGVEAFILRAKAVNKGPVPIYGCQMKVVITDTQKKEVLIEEARFHWKFKEVVPSGGSLDVAYEISWYNWRGAPFEAERYTLDYSLTAGDAREERGLFYSGPSFDQYDEKRLVELRGKLKEEKALLDQYK